MSANQTNSKKKKRKVVAHAQVRNEALNTAVQNVPQWIVPCIIIASFLAFVPALGADFVNWDDQDYVTNNSMITDLSNWMLLLTRPVQGNYHPITMFSLALNYAISGLDAWSYHLFNIAFHLVNCVLAFRLAMLLSKRNLIISFTTALLFGIHPMHVESVAWVAERKDVLYGMFFLLGLTSYTNYIDTKSKKQYVLSVIFLILSLLSKPAAVIFPIAVFSIDLLRGRRLSVGLFAEKIAYFIPALIIGLITAKAQHESGATDQSIFPLTWKILFGFYGIMIYLFKSVLPSNLAAFHPMPFINESLPSVYYFGPLIFIALCYFFFRSVKRNKIIAFGIAFFVINLLLVLQFFTVGNAIISERYTYIPYIGLFFVFGYFIETYAKGDIAKASRILVPVASIFLIVSISQSAVWKNGAALWENAIKNDPSSRAYANRGVLLARDKNYAEALDYLAKARELNILDIETVTDLGNLHMELNKFDLAYKLYREALNLKPRYYRAMDDLGVLFSKEARFDSALFYFNKALEINPSYSPSYRNRASLYIDTKQYEKALTDYSRYVKDDPSSSVIYNGMSIAYREIGNLEEALKSINKAIELEQKPEFYGGRSFIYLKKGDLAKAKDDIRKAQEGGLKIDPQYLQSLGITN
jgi:protein O-mannosyl-transferase